jgi:nuclear pore complex protein Nup188
MGTLIELLNCSLDVLRRLSQQPAALQAITPPGLRGEKPLDVKDSIGAARSALETAAFYAATQVALWVARPSANTDEVVEVESEEVPLTESALIPQSGGVENRKVSLSLGLADRMRRGLAGEIASDLISVFNKSQSILFKTSSMAGSKGDELLMTVLAAFVKEHVVSGTT